MKNIFRFLFVVLWIITNTYLAHAQWVQSNGANGPLGATVRCFFVSGTNLFAGTTRGVFLSTDYGASWTIVNANITAYAFAASGTNLFAGASDGIYLSSDNGTNWTAVNTGLTNKNTRALAVSGTNIFAGTYDDVYLSTNNGASWSEPSYTLFTDNIFSLAVSGTNIFAGISSTAGSYIGGVWLSTNNGTNWTAVNTGLTNRTIHTLAVSGTKLFAGTSGGGVCLSTNNGTNWTAMNTGLTNSYVYAFAFSGSNIFTGTVFSASQSQGYGIFLSTNNGTSWTAVNTGLTQNISVYSLAVSGSYLFAGTQGSGVWKRPLSDITTAVERSSNDFPTQFSLDQNYPNPFNPTTTISFSLPSKSFVSLKVFNALGSEVSTLVAEELAAGTYSRRWDAAILSSGVYFYRLSAVPSARRDLVPNHDRDGQAGSFTQTKKLLLLR